MDRFFRVETIASTPNPQSVVYAAMHQDYSEGFVADESPKNEEKAGELIVRRLLSGERGHYGPLEQPSITLNCGYFPHSVLQQARTHRVGITFDVQSFRFQSGKVIQSSKGEVDLEEVFYLRPVGQYHDRSGKKYFYSEDQRRGDLEWCQEAAERYAYAVEIEGHSEEHARGVLPFDYRQHFIVSFNARSLMHFFDMRAKPDAQLEIQQLCDLMFPHFEQWMPAVANWYKENRWRKGRLAP